MLNVWEGLRDASPKKNEKIWDTVIYGEGRGEDNKKKNPHQNLPNRIELRAWNLEHKLREGVKVKINYFCKIFRDGWSIKIFSTKFFFQPTIFFNKKFFLTKFFFQTKKVFQQKFVQQKKFSTKNFLT